MRYLGTAAISIATLLLLPRVETLLPALPPDGDLPLFVWAVAVCAVSFLGIAALKVVLMRPPRVRAPALLQTAAVSTALCALAWLATGWGGAFVVFAIAGDAEPSPTWVSSPILGAFAVAVLTAEALLLAHLIAQRTAATPA